MHSSDITRIKQTIFFNTVFVVTIIMLLSLQVIRSYSGNLKLLFDYQLKALAAVEAGDYSRKVPIVTQDEFSLIAEKTNQMIEGLQRAASEEDDFFDMSMTVSNEVKLFPLLGKIASISRRFLDADRCTLFLYDGKTDELWCIVGEGIEDRDIRFSAKQGIAGQVFQSRATLNIPDAYEDSRFNQAIDKLTGYRTKTILCMPILDKESNCLGVIQAINKHGDVFNARDEKRLKMFSGQAAIAISNAQLFEDINAMKNYNESILKSLNDGVITLDEDNTIIKANEAALKILNEEEYILGHTAAELFNNKNDWVLKNLHQTVDAGKAVLSMDANMALRNGEQAAVNLNTVPLLDLENNHIGSMMIIEDITNEKRMRSTMSRYMTEEVADRLLSGDDSALGGTAQDVSVLFSDIRGFTNLSESIGARETVTMLNDYFSHMVDAVFQHNGILDKYIGDAIMAVFGAPFTSERDSDNSVKTAIEMMRALNKFNHSQIDRGVMPLEIGIGISSGEVISGNIGSPKRMDYTVIGDTVNLASRLEGTTKFYSCPVVICAKTHASLHDDYVSREIDSIRVKGKDRPIVIYEILDYHTPDSFPHLQEAIAHYNAGVSAYKTRNWQEAMQCFKECLDIKPADGPSKIYLQRCEYFLQHPPTRNWDGVWTMEVK
jgi:adenylate cyclase